MAAESIGLMMLAAAVASPAHHLRCDLTTIHDGEAKRTTRSVELTPNSWQEAEPGQRLSELCGKPGAGGYRCSLNTTAFTATSQAAGPEPSTVLIDLRSGSYVDRGYMNGKPIITRGVCKRK